MTTEVITMEPDVEVDQTPRPWSDLMKRVKDIVDTQEQNAIDHIIGPEVDDETYERTREEIFEKFSAVRRRWTMRARQVIRGADNRPQFDWSDACADVLYKADEASHYIVMQYYGFCGEIDFDEE